MQTYETDIETLECGGSADTKSNSSKKKLTEHSSMRTSTAWTKTQRKAAVSVQSWWRMVFVQMVVAPKGYRDNLRRSDKVTFVFALIIRILVITYLLSILRAVVLVIYNEQLPTVLREFELEATGPAKPAASLENSVLRELMMENSSGYAIIAACR